jgi:hypothetical protein
MSDGSIRRQTGPLITPISTPKPAPKIEPPKAPEPPKEAPKTESQDTLHPPTTDATREAIAGPIDPRQLENLRGTFTTLDAAMDFAAKDKGSELIQSFEIEGQTVYTVQDLDTRQKAEELMSEEAGLAMVLDQNRGLDILDTGEEASAPPEIRMAELLELAEGAALNEHTALNSREGLKHGQLQKNLGELIQGLVDQHAVLHREMTAQPPDSPRAAILKNQMQEAELMYLALKTRMQILPDTRQRNPQTGLVIKGTGVPIPAMPTMSDWGKALDTQPSDNIVGCLRSQSDKVQTQIEGYIKAIKGSPEAETPHGQRALRVYQATQEVFGDLSAQAQQAKDRTDERKKALGAISDALHDAQQQLTGYKQELQALDTALQHGAPDLSAIETRVNEIGEHLNQVHGRLLNEMETELGIFRDHVSENKAGGKAAIALLEGQILKLRAVADAPPHKMLQALEEALPQWKEGAWLKELTQAGRSFDGITPGEVTQVGQVVDQTNGYLETRAQNQVKQTEVQGQVKVQKLARELESVATEAFHLKPPGNYSEATQQLQTLSTYATDMQDVLEQHLDGVKTSPEWQSLELVKDLLQQQQQPPSTHNTPEAKAKLKADIQHTLDMISEPDVRKSIALLADIAFERCSGHDKLKQTESQNLPEIEVKRHTRVHPRYESETTTTSLNAPDLKDNPLQATEVDAVQTEVNNATLDILIEHYDKAGQRFEEFAKSDDLMLDVLVAEAKRLKEANPGKNNREGIIRMMNIYFGGGDHEGNSKYAHMADAIFKLAHGGDRKNPYVQNTVLPYLRKGVAKRLETLQERATVLKAMKAGGLNEFDQTVAAAMNLSPENKQLLNRKRVDDLVLSTLQKNPAIRQQVFDRMRFKHSADQFPTAENLPQKPAIENFSGRKEVLFIYQAAHEGEPSVGDFLEGVVKDLPGIKTVVQAMEAYDKEVGASAHINSIDEAAKAKRAVVVGIVETIGTTGLDIMTAGATRALRLKGVVASVVENTVSAGADSLMNDSNFFENLGKGMVVGKVFELGGKALDLRINKNRDMSITTPDGKTLHGKVLDLDPHSGQMTVKLDGSNQPVKLDVQLNPHSQPKQHAVENLDMEPMELTASDPSRPAAPMSSPQSSPTTQIQAGQSGFSPQAWQFEKGEMVRNSNGEVFQVRTPQDPTGNLGVRSMVPPYTVQTIAAKDVIPLAISGNRASHEKTFLKPNSLFASPDLKKEYKLLAIQGDRLHFRDEISGKSVSMSRDEFRQQSLEWAKELLPPDQKHFAKDNKNTRFFVDEKAGVIVAEQVEIKTIRKQDIYTDDKLQGNQLNREFPNVDASRLWEGQVIKDRKGNIWSVDKIHQHGTSHIVLSRTNQTHLSPIEFITKYEKGDIHSTTRNYQPQIHALSDPDKFRLFIKERDKLVQGTQNIDDPNFKHRDLNLIKRIEDDAITVLPAGSGPTPEIFPDSIGSKPVPAYSYEIKVKAPSGQIHNIDMIIPEEIAGKKLTSLERDKLAEQVKLAVQESPEEYINNINQILVHPSENKNRATFLATASADGTIDIYPNLLQHNQAYINRTMLHEHAHVIAGQIYNNKSMLPDGTWQHAVQKDMQQGGSVTGYAQVDSAEDFAETVALYLESDGGLLDPTLRERYPHRFEALDQIFTTNPDPDLQKLLSSL